MAGAFLLLLTAAASAGGYSKSPPDWRAILVAIEAEHRRFGEELGAARSELAARLSAAEADELLARLDPPRRRAPGYGVLPEVSVGPLPTAPRSAEKKRYQLGALRGEIPGDRRDVAQLRRDLARSDPAGLEALVTRYEQLRWRHENVGARIRYHELWQADVRARPAFYAERNELLVRAQALQELQQANAIPDRIESLRRGILDALTPFAPQPSLRARREGEDVAILEVPIVTDIEDRAFLEIFEEAIEETFNPSHPAQSLGLQVDLNIETISPATLYDGSPPRPGDPIVASDHLERFPSAALVLTTGADTTHAFVGRHIQLGPGETSPHELAHEFGHLLGFSDAYLRGYEGSTDDPEGMVIVEWVGLRDDLMGNSGSGRVSEAMVEQLLEAYGPLR